MEDLHSKLLLENLLGIRHWHALVHFKTVLERHAWLPIVFSSTGFGFCSGTRWCLTESFYLIFHLRIPFLEERVLYLLVRPMRS